MSPQAAANAVEPSVQLDPHRASGRVFGQREIDDAGDVALRFSGQKRVERRLSRLNDGRAGLGKRDLAQGGR